jgi:hypothetical protein
MQTKKVVVEEVVREFPPIGKYRVRLVQGRLGRSLDIREYISDEKFEGFTRRGVRISSPAEVDLLKDTLKEVLESGSLALAKEGKTA